MSLTWKDLVTTLVTGLMAYWAYLSYVSAKLPIIASYRWGIVVLGLIGLALCIFNATGSSSLLNPLDQTSTTAYLLTGLGFLAVIIVLLGLILGTQLMFLILAGIIVAMWLLTTVRHAVG